jgi:hypothetical protein
MVSSLSHSVHQVRSSRYKIFRKITEENNSKTGIVVPEVGIVMERSILIQVVPSYEKSVGNVQNNQPDKVKSKE